MHRCTLGTSLGSFSDKKKMQQSLPERQTKRKNWCPRLPRHTGNPQLKYGKASATTSWKTKSTRTPSLVSKYEKTGDSRFAPNLLPYTGVRAVFFGVTCAVVRKVILGNVQPNPTPWLCIIMRVNLPNSRTNMTPVWSPRAQSQWTDPSRARYFPLDMLLLTTTARERA